jgi:Protein of unknown function (DUF429)
VKIYGIDFTSAPKRDKPIVVADCEAQDTKLVLERFLEFTDWPAFELWLEADGEWIGGFDFPFGLPRRFVKAQGWPSNWPGMVRACVAAGKERFADTAMQAFVAARSNEDKHRATDLVTNSHSPLKTRTNPPVGLMFYEGAWRLLTHGIRIPALHENESRKVALEAYPGFAVKRLRERYYKNDKRDAGNANSDARKRILEELLSRSTGALSCAVALGSDSLRERLLHASGDWLDAVLCATQAHWAWLRRDANFGLPRAIDPREGWIVTA